MSAVATPDRADPAASISAFLTGTGELPPTSLLLASGLAPWAWSRLDPDDPRRAGVRPAVLDQAVRHTLVRESVASLLRAWGDAGIEALLFKGFAMTEFVYPWPGPRFYGDVDVVVRPGDGDAAIREALRSGWISSRHPPYPSSEHGHALARLVRTDADDPTSADLHRFVMHARIPPLSLQRRVTSEVWENAERRLLNGVPVRVPAPVDAALVLALQRAGEGWGVKPADWPDLVLLRDEAGVTRGHLLDRADALGCRGLVETWLRSCDPWHGTLSLKPPGLPERIRRGAALFGEHPGLLADAIRMPRLLRGPDWLRDVLRQLPAVAASLWMERTYRDLEALLAALDGLAPSGESGPRRPAWQVERGVRGALRPLPSRHRTCRTSAVALYGALRREGFRPAFVSGVRREEGAGSTGEAVAGHAWVELDGRVIPGGEEERRCRRYREILRWPG